MIALFNQYPYPVAIVNAKGMFLFFNENFEKLIKEKLGLKPLPTSIFKLTSTDEDSTTKIKNLITDLMKKENLNHTKLQVEKNKIISIKMCKKN